MLIAFRKSFDLRHERIKNTKSSGLKWYFLKLLNHIDKNWGKFWKNVQFKLIVKLTVMSIFLEFISILIFIVFFNEIITPINHENSFKELVN